MADYSFESKLKSYWCGKGIQYQLLSDSGSKRLYGAGNIKTTLDGSKIDEIHIIPYDSETNPMVTVFKGDNCDNFSYAFKSDHTLGGTGTKVWANMALNIAGFQSGEISSLMIPKGMTVDLYTGDNATGEKRSFVGEYIDSNESMYCQKVIDSDFKNQV